MTQSKPHPLATLHRRSRTQRVFWFGLGIFSLAAGIVGIVLPLLPTVPFLLLAAFAFARSSQRFHDWLVYHPRFGPPIAAWRDHGAISRRGKWLATAAIVVVFAISIALGVPLYALALQAAVLGCVAIFIWSRPLPPDEQR